MAARPRAQAGPRASGAVDAVVFDLGGVLVRFGGVTAMRELAAIETDDELWERWLTCRWVRSFESGGCSDQEFARGMVADWGLDLSPAAFLAAFESWPEGPFPGSEELVREVKGKVSVACLSNTNSLHWYGHAAGWPVSGMFDATFLSFQLGLIKPDREIYEHVARALPVPADRVLVLDDNLVNVDQARAVGFRAVQVRGVEESRRALVATGVLAGEE